MMSAANGKEVRSSRGSVTGSRRQALMGSAAWPRSLAIGLRGLQSGAVLSAGVLATMLMGSDSAFADCVVTTAGSPDTIVCSNADIDGVSLFSTDGTGVNVTLNALSTLSTAAGTNMSVTLGALGGTRTFNFDMASQSQISSATGTQVLVTGASPRVRGTWNINGVINSLNGSGIVMILPIGTGNDGIVQNISGTGQVLANGAAANAISIGGVSGTTNYTLNNGGHIYNPTGGGVFVTAGLGGGTFNITNNNTIGDTFNAIGGSAVSLSGATANGTVTNNVLGQVVNNSGSSAAVNMLQGGTGTVNNYGRLQNMAPGGTVINMLVGGNATVLNSGEDAILIGNQTLISALGNADMTNTDGATWTFGGTSSFTSLTGNSTIENSGESNIFGVGPANTLSQISALGNSTLTNIDSSTIDLQGDSNTISQAAGTGNALISNTDLSSINLQGGSNTISQVAGGTATIFNDPSQIVMNGASNIISQAAASDTTITNTDLSSILMTATGNNTISQVTAGNALVDNSNFSLIDMEADGTNLISQVAAGSATIVNNDPGDILAGIFMDSPTANLISQVAGVDALLSNNTIGGVLMTGGGTNTISQVAANNTTITNDTVAGIVMAGSTNLISQAAGNDATITNDTIAGIAMAGATNLLSQAAGNDATIRNTLGAGIGMLGQINTISQVAGNDALIVNDTVALIGQLGAVNLISQAAGNDASIENTSAGGIAMLGATNVISQVADNDTTITNTDSSIMLTGGGVNSISQVAGGSAMISNDPSQIVMEGLVNLITQVAAVDATINNDESLISMSDVGGGPSVNTVNVVAGNDATINNTNGSLLTMTGFNFVTMLSGNDATINNSDSTITFDGITVVTTAAGGASAVYNGGVVNVYGFASFLGLDDFNNSVTGVGSGLLNMQNGISDYTLLTVPVYNSGVGDVLAMSGSFNGGAGSELGVDSFLGGIVGSSSDLLIVESVNHGLGPDDPDGGATAVFVNDTNMGPGAYNPIGIPVIGVVSGQTQLGDFHLANGPIDKGLFSYDLFLDSPGSLAAAWTPPFFDDADAWVLASYADATAYEFPQTISIAQGMWHTLSGTWLDRAADLRSMHGSTGGGGADPVVPSAQKDDNGVWARIIGFGADRDVSYTTEPFPDQFVTVDADYSERMGAIQGGIDHAFDSGSGSFVVGLLAGYAYNNIDFDGAGDTAKISAPHVGAYASWISDGTYVSGLIKADFLNVDYDLVGLGEQASTDGYSLGGRVEAGHRFQMGRAFIEPVASLAYVHTSLDNITAGGTDITFNDGSSLRGKIGARLGFTSMTASGQFDPYVHAYVGNEFLGDNSAFFASGPGLTVTDDVSGIFGEVGGGFNYLTTDRRTSIYGQANYIFADGYQAGNVKLGVRMNW